MVTVDHHTKAFFALMVHQEDSAAFFLLLWLAAGTGEVG